MSEPRGEYFFFSAVSEEQEKLSDPKEIDKLLVDLVGLIGMELMPFSVVGCNHVQNMKTPIVSTMKPNDKDSGGLTGSVMGIVHMSTSNITIHTWPKNGQVELLISTCEPAKVNPEVILDHLVENFGCYLYDAVMDRRPWGFLKPE